MSGPSPGEEAATRKAMKRIRRSGRHGAQIVARTRAFFGPAAAHPASYFLPFVVVACWTWPCLSCLDFAWAATLALAIFFCFWLRCFDLGDLSLMVAPFNGGGHLCEDRSLLVMGQAVKPS